MIHRHLQQPLTHAASNFPVVMLIGPRQSGKTTLARATFAGYRYASLEDPDQRAHALEDPRGFLAAVGKPVILDEVQRTPELFSYLQGIVDRDAMPGQYILTGSQNFLLMSAITQSLAGRAAVVHLLPFSLAELEGREPLPPGRNFYEQRETQRGDTHWTDAAWTGFYPRIHDRGIPAQEWLAEYVSTYVERDLRQVLRVGDLEAFQRFLRLCGGRAGQLLDLTALGADTGIERNTARNWLSALETSFLVFRLPAHHNDYRKRLTRSPKLYFVDTGLLCYLLGIRSAAELRSHSARGAVFENFVIAEILKRHHHRRERPSISFWRDSNRNEIDAIVEGDEGLIALEIKSGETVASDWLDGLRYWRKLVGDPEARGAIVYGGRTAGLREGIEVLGWDRV